MRRIRLVLAAPLPQETTRGPKHALKMPPTEAFRGPWHGSRIRETPESLQQKLSDAHKKTARPPR
eukprot:7701238-Pyramimonas_sp.AAC.1